MDAASNPGCQKRYWVQTRVRSTRWRAGYATGSIGTFRFNVELDHEITMVG